MRDGAAIVRAEMRRATREKPRRGEAHHEHVRRLLETWDWHDATDRELVEATGASLRTVRSVRQRLARDTVDARLRVLAADVADRLGYRTATEAIEAALVAMNENASQRPSGARERGAATSGHLEGETGDTLALRARVAALLDVSRELRRLRVDHCTPSSGGALGLGSESAAYRETAAGVGAESIRGSRDRVSRGRVERS